MNTGYNKHNSSLSLPQNVRSYLYMFRFLILCIPIIFILFFLGAAPAYALDPPSSLDGAASPASITWSWTSGGGEDFVELLVKDDDGNFVFLGNSTSTTYIQNVDAYNKPLKSDSLYTVRALAVQGGTTSAPVEDTANTTWVPCSNGTQCRIGEICYDFNGDGDVSDDGRCLDWNRCDPALGSPSQYHACFVSACPPGIDDAVDPIDASCYKSSLSDRRFSDRVEPAPNPSAGGKCLTVGMTSICDLFAAPPRKIKACDTGEANCQEGALINNVPVKPVLQWNNGDPPETITDYRGSDFIYIGNDTQHQIQITRLFDGAVRTYDFNNYPTLLAFDGNFNDATKAFDFDSIVSGTKYLDYDTSYNLRIFSQDQTTVPFSQSQPDIQLNTLSVCDVLQYDYTPRSYLDPQYSADNTIQNSNVKYPVDVTISFPPPSSLITSGALKGQGGGPPKYSLQMQEFDGVSWQPFTADGAWAVSGSWGVVFDNSASTAYTFGKEPRTYLKYANPTQKYRFRVLVYHGQDYAAYNLTTACPKPTGFFEFQTTSIPQITLSQKLVGFTSPEVTYKVDFSITGGEGELIRNFFIKDLLDSARVANTDKTDDVLLVSNPTTVMPVSSYFNGNTSITWKFGKTKVGWWKFDECSGNIAYDSTSYENNGAININLGGSQTALGDCVTINGASSWYNGRVGKYNSALSLDAWDDAVKLPGNASFDINGDMSISAWAYLPSTYWGAIPSSGGPIVNKYYHYSFMILPDRKLTWADSTLWSYASFGYYGLVPMDQWVHLAVTKKDSTVTIYMDNAVVVQKVFGGSIAPYPSSIAHIGCYSDQVSGTACRTGSGLFYGLIDDVHIYNYALSSLEVQDVYNNVNLQDQLVQTGSSGSFIVQVDENSGLTGCSFIQNNVTAGGTAINGEPLVISAPLPLNHLASSDSFGPGFLTTQRGNIHSNASICLSKAPPAGFYIGDYLVTAKDDIFDDAILTPTKISKSAKSNVITNSVYVKENAFTIDKRPGQPGFTNVDYSALQSLAVSLGKVVNGECSPSELFDFDANGKVILGGKVYWCKSGGGGGVDHNLDGVTNNGDLVITKQAVDGLIIHAGFGAGTIMVDGNLYIEEDIVYSDSNLLSSPGDSITDANNLASIGWVVRGSVYFKERLVQVPEDCNVGSLAQKWCSSTTNTLSPTISPYNLTEMVGGDLELSYGPVTVGPVYAVGTFFAEGKFYTGKIHLPLTIDGGIVADDIILERLGLPDS